MSICCTCQHYVYHHDEPTIDAWADFYDSSGDGFCRVYMCSLMEAAEAMGTDFKCEYKPEWEARNENKM